MLKYFKNKFEIKDKKKSTWEENITEKYIVSSPER